MNRAEFDILTRKKKVEAIHAKSAFQKIHEKHLLEHDNMVKRKWVVSKRTKVL